ncbi:MAG: LysR family transcriptional regulator [Candidatus Nanopelagicales bacterium]
MTLTQLEAFVLVARLGSVKEAAAVLGVSEPAVSSALAALRQHLGDPLLVRTSQGMELSPGGQRLVGIASQMVNLAADADAAIRRANGAPDLLRVVATSTIAEFVAPPLLDAFTGRSAALQTSINVAASNQMPVLLQDRLADVALGPRLSGVDSVPLARHKLVVVAGPHHPLRSAVRIAPESLARSHWLIDPVGADPHSDVGRLLVRLRVPERRMRVFSSTAAVRSAAAEGHGVAATLGRLVAADVAEGRLVVLPVVGTPVDILWYVSTLEASRRTPVVGQLLRFLSTPDAMHIMHRTDGSIPASRFRPPVHVTLWS